MKLRIPLSLILSAATVLPADLPVKQVVLYKHGVGFFERSGKLGAGESARLDFNAPEMNDVLKSLTIGGDGKITGLRYDSMDPLGRKLAEFPFQIGAGGMPGMLDQLKGARIELKLGTEAVTGVIVSARTIPGSDKQAERDQLNLLLDTGEFRTVDLAAATGLRFPDPKLQQQFKDYLAALSASRSKEKRSVYIDSTDAKERDVTASYMIPAAGVEIQLPPDLRRQGADAGRLGHRGQHHRRRLDQGPAFAGVRPADFLHQPALCAQVRDPSVRRTGRRPRGTGGSPFGRVRGGDKMAVTGGAAGGTG